MRKLKFLILIFCLGIATNSTGLSFEEDFTVVLIDSDTEAIFGPFPFDRAILAKAVERLSEAGAKGVVFKFFIDQAKGKMSDAQLVSSFKSIPVIWSRMIWS
jgi:CHASE2 domain-containing sensor protein